jgi:cobaltochelatase CobT
VACLARFHDPLLHSRLQPKQGDAATLLAAAEQVRCLELGAKLYPGIATSQLRAIADRYAAKAAERRSHPLPGYTANNSATDQAQALADLLWMRWHDGDANQPLMQQLAMENPQLVRLVNQMAGQLQSQLYSQRDFATLIRDLAQRLGIASTQPDAGTEDEGEDQADNADGANDGQFTPETGTEPPPASDPMPLPPSPMQDAQAKVKTVNENGQESQDLPPRLDPLAMVDQQVGYHVYSREDDEVADAASLLQSTKMWTSELLQDHDAAQYRQLVKRLAMKLEKLLRTERPLYWQGNQLDGALDPKRLARLVTSPLQPPIFRQPSLLQTRDTVVSLLLDCSGSMRGRPIRLAMLTVDVLLQTLERCHISTELLGFTTRSWKGGRAREKWMEAGKPPFPGRLNDLRHLLFKTANQRWQQRRNSLGALLQEGVLKENIDGEALMWAARRLLPRPERRATGRSSRETATSAHPLRPRAGR